MKDIKTRKYTKGQTAKRRQLVLKLKVMGYTADMIKEALEKEYNTTFHIRTINGDIKKIKEDFKKRIEEGSAAPDKVAEDYAARNAVRLNETMKAMGGAKKGGERAKIAKIGEEIDASGMKVMQSLGMIREAPKEVKVGGLAETLADLWKKEKEGDEK